MGAERPRGNIERVSAWERKITCGWCGRVDAIIAPNNLPVSAKLARQTARFAGYRGSERHGWLCGTCHQSKPWGWEEQTEIYVVCSGCTSSISVPLNAGSARPGLIQLGWIYAKDEDYPQGRWLCGGCAEKTGAVDSLNGALLPIAALEALAAEGKHAVEPRAQGVLIRQVVTMGNKSGITASRERIISPATWAAVADAAASQVDLDDALGRLLAAAQWSTDFTPERTLRKSKFAVSGHINCPHDFYVPGGSVEVVGGSITVPSNISSLVPDDLDDSDDFFQDPY